MGDPTVCPLTTLVLRFALFYGVRSKHTMEDGLSLVAIAAGDRVVRVPSAPMPYWLMLSAL